MRKLAIVCLAVVMAVALSFGAVFAEGTPSSKCAVAMSGITLIEATSGTASWDTILTTIIKVPEQKDLAFDVSLQCGLYTDTLVKSKGGIKDTSTAEASVKVRVKVTDSDGIVKYAGPAGADGVVFARRSQTLSAKLQGILGLATDGDGNLILEILEPEEIQLILDTMNANAFNFLLPNCTSGIHTVEVQAEIDTGTSFQEGSAEALATIGLGSMVTEEVRMANGSDGNTL